MMSIWLHLVSMGVILLFSLYSTIHFMLSRTSGIFVKVVATFAFLGTVITIFKRDTYLPFLGYAAFPPFLIPDADVRPKTASQEIELSFDASVKDGTRVIYWGALPSENVASSPQLAYGNFQNTGVTTVQGGKAKVAFACPAEYRIPSGRKLNRHIHYRLCCAGYGLLGPVETAYVRC